MDEAGRGPLAGPVVAAAVVLGEAVPSGLADSKTLSAKRRAVLDEAIRASCGWAVAVVEPEEIDRLNIFQATMEAMTRAVGLLTEALGDLAHHRIGDLVRGLGPGVDDLVVLLALGDQAVIVLLLIFLGQLVGTGNQLDLGARDQHVVLAEGNAGAAGMTEPELHDAVTENDRVFLTGMAIDGIDHLGDVFLCHLGIDDIEIHLAITRQEFTDNHATRGRVMNLGYWIAIKINCLEASFDLGVKGYRACFQSVMQFTHVGECHPLAWLFVRNDREIIETQNHVLRRNDDRLTVSRVQDVVG